MAAIVTELEDKYGYRKDDGQRPGAIPPEQVTEEEWAVINAFRDKYEDGENYDGKEKEVIDFSDPYLTYDLLLRFLRARNLDLNKTNKMLKGHLEWREKWKPDEITQEDIPTALTGGNWRIIPDTKQNIPCIFVDLAKWNPHQYTCDEYVRMVAYFQNMAPKGANIGVHQIVVIFDMEGWAMWHGNYFMYIKALVGIAQDQYPERLANIFIYNAPFIFRATWTLISPLVDERTRSKIEFVTDSARLLEVFNEEELPAQVGGGKKEPYPVPNISGQPNVEEKHWKDA